MGFPADPPGYAPEGREGRKIVNSAKPPCSVNSLRRWVPFTSAATALATRISLFISLLVLIGAVITRIGLRIGREEQFWKQEAFAPRWMMKQKSSKADRPGECNHSACNGTLPAEVSSVDDGDDGGANGTDAKALFSLLGLQRGGQKKMTEDGMKQQLPIHMVQIGRSRTATTVQFEILCASLLLKLLDGTTFENSESLLNNMDCGFDRFDFRELHPLVVKTHTPLEFNSNNFTGWVFTTAKTGEEAGRRREELEALGYTVPYVQVMETVEERGHHIAKDYAAVFDLTPTQRNDLLEFMKYWDILRLCCGLQMSRMWRAELIPAEKRESYLRNAPEILRSGNGRDFSMNRTNYQPHACSMYNITSVEKLFQGTAIYKEMVKHVKLKYMARPSRVDGELNGSYCWKYNELVRTKGVWMNRGKVGNDHVWT